ncbi:hypothetical protein GUJ93_ZPchr0006g44480 [Zizania palustris]|uniref:Uncharacterized protein n=1 Tax=Zizania palustris TaxID=103762 RepID=A0A8J5VM49_ZIZPA|nr:hypothetical protein GUJ93_ZPchr0006g44480 [Zizania palustris]
MLLTAMAWVCNYRRAMASWRSMAEARSEGDVACSGGSSSGGRALLGYLCQSVAAASSSHITLPGSDSSFILGLSNASQGSLALLGEMFSGGLLSYNVPRPGGGRWRGKGSHECSTARLARGHSTARTDGEGKAAEGRTEPRALGSDTMKVDLDP